MQIPAKLIKLLPLQSGLSINGSWSKRNFIVETIDDYPKKACISIWNGRVDISELEIGKEYTFHLNVESRQHHEKWYTELTLWKIGRESTVQTGRPMLDIMSPILNGNESNLEIIQKFQEEICTILSYTKGIRVGNKISDTELIIDTRVLDYIAHFKNWMNEVAFIYISDTIKSELLNKDGFLKYPKVVQKYLINTILETYYGYKPVAEEIASDHPEMIAKKDQDFSNITLLKNEIEDHKITDQAISESEINQTGLWIETIPSTIMKNPAKDEISKESEPEGKREDDAGNIKRLGKLKIDPEKLKNLHSTRKIKKDESNDSSL